MHKIKEAFKKRENHWQHEETGYVCTSTFKPSKRWFQITKKQYEDYLGNYIPVAPERMNDDQEDCNNAFS